MSPLDEASRKLVEHLLAESAAINGDAIESLEGNMKTQKEKIRDFENKERNDGEEDETHEETQGGKSS